MMEFIIFLSKLDKEIIKLINRTNYSIEENTALCLIDKKFVGFYKKLEKKIVICTENAKRTGNYKTGKFHNNNDNHKTKLFIRRALRHEATHMVQACNNGKLIGGIKNIKQNKKMALQKSLSLTGSLNKEIEAYNMEDKPKLVIKAIKKYCL